MMKTTFIKPFLVLAASVSLLLIQACSKPDTETEPTKTELLTKDGWVVQSAFLLDGSTGIAEDVFTPLAECAKDDITFFKSDGVVIMGEGAIKCNPNNPDEREDGSWSWTNNETEILRTNINGTKNYFVDILNDTALTFRFLTSDTGSVQNTLTINYKTQ